MKTVGELVGLYSGVDVPLPGIDERLARGIRSSGARLAST